MSGPNPCRLFNQGICRDPRCERSHAPDEFSLQLRHKFPNLCKSWFLYHESCKDDECPYTHDLVAAGIHPNIRTRNIVQILSEFRKNNGAFLFSSPRVQQLLNEPPRPQTRTRFHISIWKQDPHAVVFCPIGPIICSGFLLDPKGCTVAQCAYSHDLSPLNLEMRSKESILELFDAINAYWHGGMEEKRPNIYLSSLQPTGNPSGHDFTGLNGIEILQLVKKEQPAKKEQPVNDPFLSLYQFARHGTPMNNKKVCLPEPEIDDESKEGETLQAVEQEGENLKAVEQEEVRPTVPSGSNRSTGQGLEERVIQPRKARKPMQFYPIHLPDHDQVNQGNRYPKENGWRRPKFMPRNGEIVGGSAPPLGVGNKGRAMLQKMGWNDGESLGAVGNSNEAEGGSRGILKPIEQRVKLDRKGF